MTTNDVPRPSRTAGERAARAKRDGFSHEDMEEYAPPRQLFPVVRRPRIVDRLAKAVTSTPLTVVWSPAGSGKTTLAATWAANPPVPANVTWLRIDPRQWGPETIWPRITRAMNRSSRPRAGTAVGRSRGAGPTVGDLEVVVIDNAERLTDPAVGEAFDRWLTNRPDALRVILLSRTEPPLPLHRYRLDGSVAELTYADLAFSNRDTKDLLQLHDVRASDATARLLVRRTGGWAAGLRMAALAMSRSSTPLSVQDVEACLKPSHNLMADYFVAEVLQPMTPLEKQLLVSTCVYPEIDPALVEEVTGQADCAHLLTELSRRHAFVQPTGISPESYRVHPLLRQALYAEACHEDPDSVRRAHRRAGRWYAARGQIAKALEHLLLGREWADAVDLVVDRGLAALLVEPDGAELARRLESLPADPDDPMVSLVRAAAALRLGDPTRARCELAVAEPHLTSDAVSVRRARAVVTMCVHHASDDPGSTVSAARQAESTWESEPDDGVDPGTLRALVLRTKGEAETRAGLLDDACASLTDAFHAGPAVSYPERIRCLATRALAEAARGRLSAAAADVRRVDTTCRSGKVTEADRPAAIELARAWVAIERQDLAEADRILAQVVHRPELSVEPLPAAVSTLLRVRLARDRGEAARVRAVLEVDDAPIRWLRMLADAESVAGPAAVIGTDARRDVQTPVELLLEGAEQRAASNDLPAARAELVRALRLAHTEQIQRPFGHLSARLGALLRSDPVVRAESRWLHDSGAVTREAARRRGRPADVPYRDQALSAKELEVLHHLAALLTTEEIAAAMFISVNTVKTHVRSILRKLSVSRRNQAVRRAQQLGLV